MSTPTHIPLPSKVSHVACGWDHVVIYNDSEAYGWGAHEKGALGYYPEQVMHNYIVRKVPLLVEKN